MNYRTQAFLLGTLLMAAGGLLLLYVAIQSQGVNIPDVSNTAKAAIAKLVVFLSVISFIGLGLILIGSLATFAAPQTLVASEVVSQVSTPSAKNLAKIFDSLPDRGNIIHVPRVILGGESQVLLVVSKDEKAYTRDSARARSRLRVDWISSSKVLEPMGIDLMKGYEERLKRDFFGLEVPQLAHFLSKAIVHELQLSSGFSLREISPDFSEATWTKSAIAHPCVAPNGSRYPELCELCSSVACALAKATGKPIRIEGSTPVGAASQVVTTYRMVGN